MHCLQGVGQVRQWELCYKLLSCLIKKVLAVAVEEHLPLCRHLVVAVAEQLRWLKTRLLKMDGGGGEVENPQP